MCIVFIKVNQTLFLLSCHTLEKIYCKGLKCFLLKPLTTNNLNVFLVNKMFSNKILTYSCLIHVNIVLLNCLLFLIKHYHL